MPSMTLLNKWHKIHLEHILVGLSTIISIPVFSPLYTTSSTPLSCVKRKAVVPLPSAPALIQIGEGELRWNVVECWWPLSDTGRSVSSRSEQRWRSTPVLTEEKRGNPYLSYNIVPKLGLFIKLIKSIIISIPDSYLSTLRFPGVDGSSISPRARWVGLIKWSHSQDILIKWSHSQ